MIDHYNCIIPEGSMIKTVVNDDSNLIEDCIACNDMKIEKDSFMLLQTKGGLDCPVSISMVEKITSKVFVLHCYWQDCLVIKDNVLFRCYSDAID